MGSGRQNTIRLNECKNQHLEVCVSNKGLYPQRKPPLFRGGRYLSYLLVGLKNARILFLRNFLEEKCFKLF